MAALARALELAVGDQVHQHVVFKQRDAGRGAHLGDEGLLHGGSGGIGHVHDAALAVPAFARQVQGARAFLGEGDAKLAQPGDGGGGTFDHGARGVDVTQAAAGHQRVFDVLVQRVVCAQHGGHAPLGPAAGAVAQLTFGDHGHASPRRQQQGGGQPGQAAADDENVKLLGAVEGRCGHGGRRLRQRGGLPRTAGHAGATRPRVANFIRTVGINRLRAVPRGVGAVPPGS